MSEKVWSIKCRKCDKSEWRSLFGEGSKDCQKVKCWFRTQNAIQEAAKAFECFPDDLLSASKGEIKEHDEPQTHVPVGHEGERCVNGVWTPLGQGDADDPYCGY